MTPIATIGYEGCDLDDFIATLRKAGIDILLDVREIAGSRRKGFSKTALSEALEASGIHYIHLRGLGDPEPGREAARNGEIKKFERIFTDHMKTDRAQEDLFQATELAKDNSVCLLCFERDHNHCHRKIVAVELSAILDRDIRHLGVPQGIAKKVRAEVYV